MVFASLAAIMPPWRRKSTYPSCSDFPNHLYQRQKTLVFCATQDHAALVRDLINQEKTSTDPNYCHRVTADDGKVGEQHLRDFQDNEKTVPTILTTSQKLSTGVDARNVRHIVLMRPIRSMIEFKQIIGRGTRTYDGKDFFTVWDFVKAHEKFEDPDWDGEPLPPPDPKPPRSDPAPKPPGETGGGDEGGDDGEGAEEGKSKKVVATVKLADGKERRIRYIATTTYWSADGKPISAAEFLQRLFGDLTKIVADEDQLRTIWSDPDTRERFITKLNELGYDESRMEDIRQLVDAPRSDLFDVLAYILYTIAPKTRSEQAEEARRGPAVSASGELKELLEGILDAYESAGESELGSKKLGQLFISRYGSVTEAKDRLGGPAMIKQAFTRLQAGIYKG
jgi:type I restriction enzyme R subunit